MRVCVCMLGLTNDAADAQQVRSFRQQMGYGRGTNASCSVLLFFLRRFDDRFLDCCHCARLLTCLSPSVCIFCDLLHVPSVRARERERGRERERKRASERV